MKKPMSHFRKSNEAADCEHCAYWVRRSTSSVGDCHIRAPRVVPVDTVVGVRTEFPRTDATTWCGELRRAV
jgi:hypothetical protein